MRVPMNQKPIISLIILSQGSPKLLEKTLWSFMQQTFRDFEILIFEEDFNFKVRMLIDNFNNNYAGSRIHISLQKRDERKIFDDLLTSCNASYIVFTASGCIAREDFLQTHYERRENGTYLTGGDYKLPIKLYNLISKNSILTQRCFDVDWLLNNGLQPSYLNQKLRSGFVLSKLMENFTPVDASWCNLNSSTWLENLKILFGSEERDNINISEKEINRGLLDQGLKPKQIRYSAICLNSDKSENLVERH